MALRTRNVLALLCGLGCSVEAQLDVKIPATGFQSTLFNTKFDPKAENGLTVVATTLEELDIDGNVMSSTDLTKSANNILPPRQGSLGSVTGTLYEFAQAQVGFDIQKKTLILSGTTGTYDMHQLLPSVPLVLSQTLSELHLNFKGFKFHSARVQTRFEGPTEPYITMRPEFLDINFPAGSKNAAFNISLSQYYIADLLFVKRANITATVHGNTVDLSIEFNKFVKAVKIPYIQAGLIQAPPPAACFPGSATVQTDSGVKPLVALQAGDRVLASGPSHSSVYQTVQGFLHQVPGDGVFVSVEHSRGEFRVSDNHVVFSGTGEELLAKDVKVGDELLTAAGPAAVISVRRSVDSFGLFAPLTEDGTIVVDGMVASNYATPAGLAVPHSAMHASFFLARALKMRAPSVMEETVEAVHPLASLYTTVLGLDGLLKAIS